MKAQSLCEHVRQAEWAWDRIASAMSETHLDSLLSDSLRANAAKSFWLYPLVEARRGAPGL